MTGATDAAARAAGLSRRDFVKGSAAAVAAAAGFPLWTRTARSAPQELGAPLLVVVFLRGAADGLHLVPPAGDRTYERIRDGALRLDATLPFADGFALHPAFEPLQFLVERGQLAVVHAAGSPDPTRSHFDAQDSMEAGTPGRHAHDGWLARALGPTSDTALFSRIALTSQLPLSLRGSRALALSEPGRLSLGRLPRAERERLEALYAGGDASDPVVVAGRRALEAAAQLRELPTDLAPLRPPGRGDRSLVPRIETLRALATGSSVVEAAFLDMGDWDTHANQGGTEGRAAGRIGDLADGITALFRGFETGREVTCLVMTEFGRTVRPNGTGGTDHGHGSVMLVAGPRVRGGVHGEWRGLETAQLYEGRDLPVLTDYRDVAAEVLQAHTGRALAAGVFPGHRAARLGLFG